MLAIWADWRYARSASTSAMMAYWFMMQRVRRLVASFEQRLAGALTWSSRLCGCGNSSFGTNRA